MADLSLWHHADFEHRQLQTILEYSLHQHNIKHTHIPTDTCIQNIYQVQAQLDYGPGSEIGGGWKIGVTSPRKLGFKMAATELGYLLTKLSFWLKFMTWYMYINFLAWRQRILSLVCFANNAIHPWPQVMPIFDREMPPRFTPAICLRRNFV